MDRIDSRTRRLGVIRAATFTAAALVAAVWVPPSKAAAQAQRFCLANDQDVNPGEIYYCVHEEIGLLASLTMTGPNTASIAMRQLEGYYCEARAYNDLGRLIASIGPLTYEDEVVEDCFRQQGECYELSPVAIINFLCFQS